MRDCARASLAPATIFIARVIFCVDLTLEIRLRMTLSEGIGLALGYGGLELRIERRDGGVEAFLQVVVQNLLRGDVVEQRLVGAFDVRKKLGLVTLQRFDREFVELTGGGRID